MTQIFVDPPPLPSPTHSNPLQPSLLSDGCGVTIEVPYFSAVTRHTKSRCNLYDQVERKLNENELRNKNVESLLVITERYAK